jgi:hypothetical protein
MKLQKKLKNNNFKEHTIMGGTHKNIPQQCSVDMTLPIKKNWINRSQNMLAWVNNNCDFGSAFLYSLPRLVTKGTTLLPFQL